MNRRQPLTPEVEHFLLVGCYWGPDETPGFGFDAYLLAGAVSRGRLDRLRELWTTHAPAVKARDGHGPVYAEVLLAGGKWQWPGAPWRCAEHVNGRTAA